MKDIDPEPENQRVSLKGHRARAWWRLPSVGSSSTNATHLQAPFDDPFESPSSSMGGTLPLSGDREFTRC